MGAPILPGFFKKLDMFQTLKMLEAQGKDDIWLMQKYILKWAVGADHKHPGSIVTDITLKDGLLKELTQAGLLPNAAYERYIARITLVGKALAVNGFAIIQNEYGSLIFTPAGYLAGNVLVETDFLKKGKKYGWWAIGLWILIWLGILSVCIGILSGVVVTIKNIHDLLKEDAPPQVKVINNMPTTTVKIVFPTVEKSPTPTEKVLKSQQTTTNGK